MSTEKWSELPKVPSYSVVEPASDTLVVLFSMSFCHFLRKKKSTSDHIASDAFLGQTKGNVTPPSSALHLKSQPPSSGDSLRQISCAAASWHTVRMFQSQHGRPDISFMAVTPRLGQPASPNFSIYILFPTQGTEMLQQSRTSPGLVCCAVDMLGNEGRAIPIICAVNRTEEKEVHFRAVSGRLCRRVSRPPS